MSELGRLEKVKELRATWPDEARDFTPWLAQSENIAQLAEFLGLGSDGLEVEAVERLVGPYRADILARETASGNWVVVENQLERTDHGHLGQLIVYAAGLDARTVVWISARVSPEHKAAIEWLNEISGDDGPSFFALEIELWRIGDSLLAPRFNGVVLPNDWVRQADAAKRSIARTGSGGLSDLRQDYWTEFAARLDASDVKLRSVSPKPQSWIWHGIGRTGLGLVLAMSTMNGWVQAEIYIGGPYATGYFERFQAEKSLIEAEAGKLVWEPLETKKDCRVRTERLNCDPTDREDWPRQHTWLIERAIALDQAFRPRIAKLPRDPKDWDLQ